MADHPWIALAVYVAGFLVACRLLARQGLADDAGLLTVGVVALLWPLWAAVAVVVAPFAFLVWLAALGVKRG